MSQVFEKHLSSHGSIFRSLARWERCSRRWIRERFRSSRRIELRSSHPRMLDCTWWGKWLKLKLSRLRRSFLTIFCLKRHCFSSPGKIESERQKRMSLRILSGQRLLFKLESYHCQRCGRTRLLSKPVLCVGLWGTCDAMRPFPLLVVQILKTSNSR